MSQTSDGKSVCLCSMNSEYLKPDEVTPCADQVGINGRVVEQCPPPGEPTTNVTRCADVGAGCTVAELEQQGQLGCCEGSVCKRDEQGQAVCAEASDAERALSLKCERAARDSFYGARQPKLATPELKTSLGTIQLPLDVNTLSGVSKLGCLGMAEFHLGTGDCALGFRVDVVQSQYVVSWMTGNFAGCPGFEADSGDSAGGRIDGFDPPATFSFDGFSCGTTEAQPNDCVAGSFDLYLDGQFQPTHADTAEPPPMRITAQHLRFEGVTCTLYDGYDACPTP
ncbi:MAG TPA: hypothetical protein VER96_20810 [Polyangiaceae bacterium]|nr:hypothetical protein [Polyangiaceae bacterium]